MEEEREKAINCLRKFRNLLIDDENLKVPIHNEKFLIRFVRAKKYDAESAYKTLRKYYTMRKKYRNTITKCLYPGYEPIKSILENNTFAKLKSNDPNGCPVLMYQNDLWDLETHSLDEVIAASMVLTDELLMFSLDAQLNGVVVIFDMENFSLRKAKEYTLTRITAIVNVWQGCYPLRLKGIYVVYEPTVIDVILTPIKLLLSEKTKSRLFLFGEDTKKLCGKISPEILPEKYGGKLSMEKALDTDFTRNMLERDGYYKELMEYGIGKLDDDEEDTYL